MKRRNLDKIKDAATEALAAQVRRTLDVARIKGWDFTQGNVDVGMTIVAAAPLAIRVRARLDDVAHEIVISVSDPAGSIREAVDGLVNEWLSKHATGHPSRPCSRV